VFLQLQNIGGIMAAASSDISMAAICFDNACLKTKNNMEYFLYCEKACVSESRLFCKPAAFSSLFFIHLSYYA